VADLTVLVIGGGGREHALAWGLGRSPLVGAVHCAPGNPGIAADATCHPLDVGDNAAIVALARRLDAALVVVGPEVPLVNGAADALMAAGFPVFGPVAAGARLEGSKAWMKELLAAAGVPTARHATFGADDEVAALAYLESMPGFYVVKTDGLAAGKGVVVTESLADARDAVRSYLSGAAFGAAGQTCVIEEGLSGPEVSLLVMCDGRRGVPLAPAQDFKRIGEGDTGPNTGGMGAYSPVPGVDASVIDTLMERAIAPTLAELRHRDIDYRGVLYAGVMLTPAGPKLLEYNVRFGDPECQVVVPRLASDLVVHCLEAARGALETPIAFTDDAAVAVVLASEGYPGPVTGGAVIEGLAAAGALDGVKVFHAGTALDAAGNVVTAGGRVLSVTASAPTIAAARAQAYAAAALITWPGRQLRRDIAEVAAGYGAARSSEGAVG
jgi:phosphoribosylamine--glycine ligase